MTTERATVKQLLKDAFGRATEGRLQLNSIEESAVIMDDLGLDSLNLLEMRFELESLFGVDVSDGDLKQIRTVGELVDVVLVRMGVEAPVA